MNNIKDIPFPLQQIADNTPAIKVGDIILVAGIGGSVLPQPSQQTTGGFYKCASVNKDKNSWTGYKAEQISDSYSFASESTTLRYSYNIPVVGNIYDSHARFSLAQYVPQYTFPLPNVFYASLNPLTTSPQVGGDWKDMTGVTATTQDNVPCSNFPGPSTGMYVQGLTGMTPSSSTVIPYVYNVCFWAKGIGAPLFIGPNAAAGSNIYCCFILTQNTATVNLGNIPLTVSDIDTSKWHHYRFQFSRSVADTSTYNIELFIDGQLKASKQGISAGLVPTFLGLGKVYGPANQIFQAADFSGYIAAVRIYAWEGDATAPDLSSLHLQFTPSV